MTWPTRPQNPYEIPHEQGEAWKIEMMGHDTAEALCQFVTNNYDELEFLSRGDAGKEKILGGLLISAFNQAANSRQRTLEGLPTPSS